MKASEEGKPVTAPDPVDLERGTAPVEDDGGGKGSGARHGTSSDGRRRCDAFLTWAGRAVEHAADRGARMPRVKKTSPTRCRATAHTALVRAIVRWFHAHRRDLPWRRTTDPYAIWVSEIMLQQTRVEVVVPYYERFLARFPTPESLAAAPLDHVLTQWAGLGYYRRARQLKAAAESIVRDHAGHLPEDEAALVALPGIGRYTVGAIRSIAFGHAAPVVDGNIARVLSRIFALPGGPGTGSGDWERQLWKHAADLVPADDPSAFNQGLMELGATVCLPRSPRCPICPVRQRCRACATGNPESFPRPRVRPRTRRISLWALVLERAGRFLLRQRAEGEINAGFWEFPLFEAPASPAESAQTFLRATLRQVGAPLGARARLILDPDEFTEVRHAILDSVLRVRIHRARLESGRTRLMSRRPGQAPGRAPGWRWVAPGDFDALPFTSASRKIASVVTPPMRVCAWSRTP